jgi:hypothetical protein
LGEGSRNGYPAKSGIALLIRLFQADAGAISPTKFNRDVYQLLKDNSGIVCEDVREGLQGFKSLFGSRRSVCAVKEFPVGEEIVKFHPRIS